MSTPARLFACGLIVLHLIACSGSDADESGAAPATTDLTVEDRLEALEAQLSQQKTAIDTLLAELDTAHNTIEDLESRLTCVSYDKATQDLFIDGCNVHIRDGSGDTASTTGLGNLVIGYNMHGGARTGTHNLVVGDGHSYSSFGGLLAGESNTISAPYASITGGKELLVSYPSGWASGSLSHYKDILAINAGSLSVQVSGDADIDANSLDLAGVGIAMKAHGLLDLSGGAGINITSSAATDIRGSILMLNAHSSGLPAARVSDRVSGEGGSGSITTGSATVLIGN